MHYMGRRKTQVTITLRPELVEWLDDMVEERIFANRSHGVERCVLNYKEEYEES